MPNESPTATLLAKRDGLRTAISTMGGSTDSDMNALAVMPAVLPSCSKVTTVTPVANLPMTRRKARASICSTCMCLSPVMKCCPVQMNGVPGVNPQRMRP